MNSDQLFAFNLVNSGKNIFITGPGGVGKSYLLKQIASNYKNVFATASTGVAANLLKLNCPVTTLHSWLGLSLCQMSVISGVTKIKKSPKTLNRIRFTKMLIIDEISMVSADFFDKMNAILKKLLNSEIAFGGIQLIISGDFLQLKPVQNKFVFQSKSWNELNLTTCALGFNFRQNEELFTRVLHKLRIGIVDDEVIKFLKSRRNAPLQNNLSIRPVKLFCTNIDVDKINEMHLSELSGTEMISRSFDKGFPKGNLPSVLRLKKEAQVMLLSNINIEEGLFNGSVGKVTNLSPLMVLFSNGKEVLIEKVLQQNDYDKKWSRFQYPLKLCYATTIHKAQGSTLDLVEIDFRHVFEDAQVYVALSRCKSSENLSIKNFHPKMVKTSKEALEFYKNIY